MKIPSEQDTPRVKRLRKAYWDWIAEVVVKRLKFIDESGLHLSLTRLYGRAAAGERVVDAVPQQPDGPAWTLIGADGYLVVLVHRLPDGSRVWSAYWHVARPVVPIGQAVRRGDRIADVFDRGLNSHLHWEIRTFGDGASLFSRGSAGERGTCNGKQAGVGYTWDDDPSRARPDYWGYRDPTAFVETWRK
jgi:hypothetical protein